MGQIMTANPPDSENTDMECQKENQITFNSFLRSVLFTPIGEDRIFVRSTFLFEQRGITVKFTGEQLDQGDMAVWLALIDRMEQGLKLSSITQSVSLVLEEEEYEGLHANIRRLAAGLVEIEEDEHIYAGKLIDSFTMDLTTKICTVNLNSDFAKFFSGGD
jgi:hypothetical protein